MSRSNPTPIPTLPGDPAPWFFAPTARNPRYNFASVAGRYVLLVFPGPASGPDAAAAHALMRQAQADGLLDETRCAGFTVSIDPADDGPGGPRDAIPGHRVFLDRDLAVSRMYGAATDSGYRPMLFLLDPLLRVLGVGPVSALPQLFDKLRGLPPPELHAGAETPAPVLLLPRVFEPELCQRLIRLYEAHGGEVSGFMVERDGRTVGTNDPNTKRRRDHDIADEELQALIRARVSRRIGPEMRKAFQFDASRIERYIVACYTAADQGFFRAHRDNTTSGTAHRRFAVTINLNDDFEGGELWFPEFGPRRYRPQAGGACVFSCSLLHEATPVTRGTRYACLPFLYDEAAFRVRDAYLRREADLATAAA